MSWNPDYWGPKTKVANVNFVVIPEAQAPVAALESGTVDMVYNPDSDLLTKLESNSNLTIQKVAGSHCAYLCPNQKFKPFQDVRVRQAFDLAINKQAIVDGLLSGVAVVSMTPLSEAYGEYYRKDMPEPFYDPDKATALLKEAGFDFNQEIRLINATNSPGNVKSVDQCTAIQADLANIGVKIKIENYDTATQNDMEQNQPDSYERTYSSFSSAIGDPNNFIYDVFSSCMWPNKGFNYAHYKTDEVGRDVLSRLVWGARISLISGLAATLVAAVFGVSIGLLTGYLGGRIDQLLMRLADMFTAFPAILLALAIITTLGTSLSMRCWRSGSPGTRSTRERCARRC